MNWIDINDTNRPDKDCACEVKTDEGNVYTGNYSCDVDGFWYTSAYHPDSDEFVTHWRYIEEMYYIRTTGYIGNALIWWRPNSQGYTSDIRQAGKYSKKEAERIVRGSGDQKAYLCTTIDDKKDAQKLIIDAQFIDTADEVKFE